VAVPAFDAKHNGSDKMHIAHVPGHAGAWKAADIELEQDRDRPYVYLCGFVNFDVQIYDIRNTAAPKKIYEPDDRESRAPSRHWRDVTTPTSAR